MKKENIVKLTLKPGDPLPKGKTDWARLSAMTEKEINEAALSDPDAQPLTDEQLSRMRHFYPDVKRIRKKLHLSQTAFAKQFHFSVATIRNWEQKHRIPEHAARLLLHIIDKKPDLVKEALSDL